MMKPRTYIAMGFYYRQEIDQISTHEAALNKRVSNWSPWWLFPSPLPAAGYAELWCYLYDSAIDPSASLTPDFCQLMTEDKQNIW